MGNCRQAPKHTCGDSRSNSKCVFYDLNVPEYSDLYEDECPLVIEETTEDLYKLMTWVRESIDLKDFDKGCLDIESVKDSYNTKENRFLIKDVLSELIKKSCFEGSNGTSNNIDFIIKNLDYKCLVDDCGETPGSLQQFLQLIINKICE